MKSDSAHPQFGELIINLRKRPRMEALRHVGIKPLGQVIMVLGLGFVFWFGLLLVVDWLIGIEIS